VGEIARKPNKWDTLQRNQSELDGCSPMVNRWGGGHHNCRRDRDGKRLAPMKAGPRGRKSKTDCLLQNTLQKGGCG